MIMASTALTQPLNFPPFPSSHSIKHHRFLFPSTCLRPRRSLFLPPRVTSLPLPFPQTNDSQYPNEEFDGHGVTFKSVGDTCRVAKMVLENGSTVVLMLPHGLVTSYKAPMWHGEKMETLRSFVVEGDAGEGLVRGGMFLDLGFEDESGFSWRVNSRGWAVKDVRGNPGDFVEVELINTGPEDLVDVKYVLTLGEQSLTTAVEVSNLRSTPLKMTGSVLSHLNVSTPDATYAIGLEGSNFYGRRPIMSEYQIFHPDANQNSHGKNIQQGDRKWGLFFGRGSMGHQNACEAEGKDGDAWEETEGEENANYKHLTDEISQIYTSAPRNFTIIDRGRRYSMILGRHGFDELYMYSPGSRHEEYGNYSYICIGSSAQLKPVTIGPKQVWVGGHQLHNPNL